MSRKRINTFDWVSCQDTTALACLCLPSWAAILYYTIQYDSIPKNSQLLLCRRWRWEKLFHLFPSSSVHFCYIQLYSIVAGSLLCAVLGSAIYLLDRIYLVEESSYRIYSSVCCILSPPATCVVCVWHLINLDIILSRNLNYKRRVLLLGFGFLLIFYL